MREFFPLDVTARQADWISSIFRSTFHGVKRCQTLVLSLRNISEAQTFQLACAPQSCTYIITPD